MNEFYFTTTVVYQSHLLSLPCIINDISRVRDSNGLIVASWCLTRNRERDVIISTLTSCPPPGLWYCTLYMALYTLYRTLPVTVPILCKRRSSDLSASSRHPPLEFNLSVTDNTGYFLRHRLGMYVPGYGVSLAGTGASGAGLCVPQYVTFNPLQHQYR